MTTPKETTGAGDYAAQLSEALRDVFAEPNQGEKLRLVCQNTTFRADSVALDWQNDFESFPCTD